MTRDTDPAPVTASRTAETPHIQLLGQFHLAYGEQTCSLDSPRLQTLLAYLVLHCDAPQSRQQLAFLFFPDSTEAQARTNLRKLIHHLRNALPDADTFLVSDGQTLHWNADAPFTLDVAAFETAAAQASSATALREAVQLYRGELLPGGYDDWVVAERERLQQKFIETLERLILLLENQRDYRSAISYAEQLLRADPLREETYRHLMRLHHASGDEAGARRVYQTCVAVLQRELDAEPSVETRTEFERLNHKPVLSEKTPPSQEPAAVFDPFRAVRHNLPMSLTSFVGRAQQITDLKRLLSLQNIATRTRLVTLTGAGGSGKTRLAIQVAQDVLPSFQAGVWFVDLSPLTDPTLIPQTIAVALSVQEQPGRSLIDTLLDYLHDKELLLLLDNCEQFVAACAELVQTLLEKCPRLQILVTSRERLNLAGETVWLVPTLSLPETEIVNWMTAPHSEAVQLFVERASSALPTFALTQQNATTITQICRRLDGIPLAIELAAARIKVLTPAQIATRLDDAFHLLTRGGQAAPPRQQTLRAAMDWSYALLSAQEQMLFRRLSVFAGGFTLESAEQVCAGSDNADEIAQKEILDLLSDLVDKSLVVVAAWEDGALVRYRMLEPVREYAKVKLSEEAETEKLQQQHLVFFCAFVILAEPNLYKEEQLIWLTRLRAEDDNLRAAIAWSLHNQYTVELGLRLTCALWDFWLTQGYHSEGQQWFAQLLEKSEHAPQKLRAKAYLAAGFFAIASSSIKTAEELCEKGFALCNVLESETILADAYFLQARIAYEKGDIERSFDHAAKSLNLSSQTEFRVGMVTALNLLSELAFMQSDYERANEFNKQSLALSREMGDLGGISFSLMALGCAASIQGNLTEADSLFAESILFAQRLKNEGLISAILIEVGKVALWQGQTKKASTCFEQVLAYRRRAGAQRGISRAIIWYGAALIREGYLERAALVLREGLLLASDLGLGYYLAETKTNLGDVAQLRENHKEAIALYQESLKLYYKLGKDKIGIAEVVQRMATIALQQGSPQRAVMLLSSTDMLRKTIASPLPPIEKSDFDRDVFAARNQLDESSFAAIWDQARTMSLEDLVSFALQEV